MSGVEKFVLGRHGDARGTIRVGLVNNMPDAALRATELQFARLLKETSGRVDVQLQLFSLSGIARSALTRSRMEGFYADAQTLPQAGLDAVIVTGAEPKAADMRDEPYWAQLAQVIEWARSGTLSAIFSCLGAHAAVQHLDGIGRRLLPRKLSGVFTVERVSDHPLWLGMPSLAAVPHSRHNAVTEKALASRGYRVLGRLPDGGVDSFLRQKKGESLMLFFQGHPEYGPEMLGREYLRDIGRFLRGEAPRPAIPEHYFDRATENALSRLDAACTAPGDIARYNAVVFGALPLTSWRGHTLKLFANWLSLVAAEKARRARPPARARLRA